MSINSGGTAFPLAYKEWDEGETYDNSHDGMTLRQYYAAKVMQATVIGCGINNDCAAAHNDISRETGQSVEGIAAAKAFSYADAMIAFEEDEVKK